MLRWEKVNYHINMNESLIIILALILLIVVFKFSSYKKFIVDGIMYKFNKWKKTAEVMSNNSLGILSYLLPFHIQAMKGRFL